MFKNILFSDIEDLKRQEIVQIEKLQSNNLKLIFLQTLSNHLLKQLLIIHCISQLVNTSLQYAHAQTAYMVTMHLTSSEFSEFELELM